MTDEERILNAFVNHWGLTLEEAREITLGHRQRLGLLPDPPRKEGTMKHPFQVGDLVRSRMNPSNLAIVTKTYKCQTGFYVDVIWSRSEKEVPFYGVQRFTLVSRAEQ